MRKALLGGATALALCASGAGHAQPARPDVQAPPGRRGDWTTGVYLLASQRVPADTPRVQAAGYLVPNAASAALGWIKPEDLPEDFRRRAFAVSTILELELDPAGRISACNILSAGSEPRLAQLACRLASERLSNRPFYVAPGIPVATRLQISIAWQTWRAGIAEPAFRPPPPEPPPGPPAPPLPASSEMPWPRLDWPGHVTAASLPQIQSMFPAAATRREGRTSLDLQFTPESGITGCTIIEGSGDPALDEAACRIARTLELRYLWPCEYCTRSPLPLQFMWNRRGGSHIRLPMMPFRYAADWPDPPRDPADSRTARRLDAYRGPQRFALATSDFSRVRDRTMRRKYVSAELAVSPEGRATACMLRTTGNRAVDVRACRLLLSRRHPVRTDIFGDPVASRQQVAVDLTAVN